MESEFSPDHLNARDLTDDEVEILARIEHNRWNIEKLLVGYRAMPISQGNALSKEERNDAKKNRFIHADICPYDALADDSKHYDKIIVRYLFDVIKDK